MRVRHVAITYAVACAATLLPAGSAAAGWKHLSSSRTVHASAAAPPPATLLRRAGRAFEKRSSPVKRDLSPLLRRIAAELPRLHGAERRRAASLLARPTDGAADPQQNGWSAPEAQASPLCTAHYCVHWVDSGTDAPDLSDGNGNGVPDWVEAVAATAEHVYSVENVQLGWRPPKGDGSLGGGSNLTDIYLADVGGSGIYGYSAPDNQPESHSLYAYLVLDNDFSPTQFPGYSSRLDPLDVTLAHEYNHVLQFNYDVFEQTWMLEATAVWMEGKVYEPVHDYLQYLPGWVQLSTQPLTSFDGNNPNSRTNVKVYGSSVWNKWLDQRYGEQVVRTAWEDSVAARSFAPAAYDAAIRAHRGGGFADEFDRFAAATAEWQAQNSGFPDGSLYPDVDRVGDLEINGSPGSIKLDHTAYALVNVPLTAAPRIRLAVKSPRGTAAALALVGRVGGSPGGTFVQTVRRLPHGGNAVLTFSNPGNLSRLTAVLVNSDVQHGAFSATLQDFPFKRDGQQFYSHASTDFAAPHVTGESPRPGARAPAGQKVTVKFSEPVLGVSTRSFKLVGPGGRSVSTRLSFRSGGRKATLVPRRSLPAGRYGVRLTSAITDLTLNKLGPPAWRFKVR